MLTPSVTMCRGLFALVALAAYSMEVVEAEDYSYICENRLLNCLEFRNYTIPGNAQVYQVCSSDHDCQIAYNNSYVSATEILCCDSTYCDHYCDPKRKAKYKYLCIDDSDCQIYQEEYGQGSGEACFIDNFMCGIDNWSLGKRR
ncbi:uncharacterized protein LOC142338720 isoform X2 [Convolutriloba macropyga]|uniref:uncharacterized protein LOC142338720 isoform X2 n=1 Tax=Convolutriloba macropyga TaxID=536237 RepID=UPI003F51C5FD